MDLPDGFRFRAPRSDDLDAVGDVLLADQRKDAVEPTIDADFVRQVWARSDFDLRTDAWVVTDRVGRIVGYGQVRRDEPDLVGSWGVVHPDLRGRGIGSALFDRIEMRAGELLQGVWPSRLRHSLNAADSAAAAMARDRGLRPIRHFWHMQIDLDGPVVAASPAHGIDISVSDADNDLLAIHGILASAFKDDPGDHPEPFERWAQEQLTSPGYDPTLWFLARDRGAPVGVLIASPGEHVGWVDWLAVLESHRGRGIGSALLRHSFTALASRGLVRIRLNVDAENVTGATAVYERVGMRTVNRWDLWERVSSRDA
jgi:mycothiol synthase